MVARPSKKPKQRSKAELVAKAAKAAEEYVTGSGAPAPPSRTLEEALGVQIRNLRRQLDLTVADLAGAAQTSVGMMSKIENGQISPSLGTLQRLAGALNVPITALFSTFEEKRGASYVRANQGVVIDRRGTKIGHRYELLGHMDAGDVVVEPFLITLTKEAVPYTGFQHAGVEFIYMLTGEVLYRHGDRSYHLKPGDSLMFDSNAMHGPEELIARPMTYLSIIMYPNSST